MTSSAAATGTHTAITPTPAANVGDTSADDQPDSRRCRRRQGEGGDQRRRIAPLVLEVAVLEQAGRGDEQVAENGDGSEQREAAAVDRRGDDVTALEALGLRQVAGDRDGYRQPDQRHDVDEAPPALAEIGEGQRRHGDAGAEPAGHRQHAHRVGARAARHLLGGDDCHEEVEGETERPPDRLGGHEDREGRGERSGSRHQRSGEADGDDHRPPSDAVGEGCQRDHEDDAGAHACPGDPDARVADTEVVGGELDGLGEQRVDERRGHRRGGEQAEHAELPGRQPVRRRPRWRAVAERAITCRVVASAGDRPADREGEQPSEPRQDKPVGGSFLDRRAVTVAADQPFVLGERTGFLGEPAVAVGAFAHDVVARREHVLGGGAPGGPGTGD